MFGERPAHAGASHAADAFRYLATGLREPNDNSAFSLWGGSEPIVVLTGDNPGEEARHGIRTQRIGGVEMQECADGKWRQAVAIEE